jgi:hypothetical protein
MGGIIAMKRRNPPTRCATPAGRWKQIAASNWYNDVKEKIFQSGHR